MLRLLIAVFIVFSGAFAGIYYSDKLNNKRLICSEIGELFRKSKIFINYRGLNVYEISAELKKCGTFSSLDFIYSLPEEYVRGQNFRNIWSDLIDAEKQLPSEEKKLLHDFGAFIGKSDIQGQLSSIDALEHELLELEKLRAEEYHQKGRLYRSVGLLVGVMIGIIVI